MHLAVAIPYDRAVNMIDAHGLAAWHPRIRFGSILLLFVGGLAVSLIAGLTCVAYKAPAFASSLIAVSVQDLYWICGYWLLSHDRDWVSLRTRCSPVQSRILWASAALAVAQILVFTAIAKVLIWAGVELPELPAPDFLAGGLRWLPAAFLVIAIIGPAAEELMFRGLLLDWLRQKMSTWPAILVSALIFALIHGIALHGGATGWLQLGFRIALGTSCAYLAVRYCSLRPSFVLHAVNNCCVVFASGFA
jgi:membrane protease YdiL (CAAX protease family)